MKHGVSPEDASFFVGRSYLSMVQDAERDCHDPKRIDALVEEQTPGGLNEQVSLYSFSTFHTFDVTLSYETLYAWSMVNKQCKGIGKS